MDKMSWLKRIGIRILAMLFSREIGIREYLSGFQLFFLTPLGNWAFSRWDGKVSSLLSLINVLGGEYRLFFWDFEEHGSSDGAEFGARPVQVFRYYTYAPDLLLRKLKGARRLTVLLLDGVSDDGCLPLTL
ncbi:MAG: hypothetical protein ABIB98_01655 [bacterium]